MRFLIVFIYTCVAHGFYENPNCIEPVKIFDLPVKEDAPCSCTDLGDEVKVCDVTNPWLHYANEGGIPKGIGAYPPVGTTHEYIKGIPKTGIDFSNCVVNEACAVCSKENFQDGFESQIVTNTNKECTFTDIRK